MVIYDEPALFGSVKLPVKVAPASRHTVSPATALLMAVWTFPPEATVVVQALGV
jgi:hypothetical protein